MSVNDLIAWNGIKNNLIYPGQQLRLKPVAQSAQPAKPVEPDTKGAHAVKKGDTVWGIANLYGITMANLIAWNGIKNNVIHPGQQLIVAPIVAVETPPTITTIPKVEQAPIITTTPKVEEPPAVTEVPQVEQAPTVTVVPEVKEQEPIITITPPTPVPGYIANSTIYTEAEMGIAEINSSAKVVTLGSYVHNSPTSYDQTAYRSENTFFSMGSEGWDTIVNKLKEAGIADTGNEMWRINEKFLENQVLEGKNFEFTIDPETLRLDSFGAREYTYLKVQGYKVQNVNSKWKVVK